MSRNFSTIPLMCPNCTIGKVVGRKCQNCGNVFGTCAAYKDRRKKPRFFPSFSKGEIAQLRKKDETEWKTTRR